MHLTVSIVLVLVAVICFAFAALGMRAGRLNLVALGLACWAGSTLVS